MAAVETRVFARTGGAQLSTLPNAEGRQWQETLNETGTGALTFDRTDTDLTHMVEGNLVRCYVDGTAVFSWVVGPMDQSTIAAGAESDEKRTINGRGTLSVFSEAIVYPEITSASVDFPAIADRKPTDNRRFDFASPLFSDTSWAAAVVVPNPDALAGDRPAGWPGTPEWIWNALPDGSNNNPVGDVYFRHSFTMASTLNVNLYLTCDNGFEFYLDGELILSELRTPFLQLQTRSVATSLIAGDHVIAVRAVNHPGVGTNNPGAFVLSGFEMGDDGNPTGSPVVVTSASGWKCLGYPASPPGMTVGQILRILVQEAQTRGALNGVTLGFSDTTDTASVAWPTTPDVSFSIGKNLLEVLDQLTEVYCDVAMNPASLQLRAWVERGSAVAATFDITTNVVALTHKGGDHKTITAVLGRYGDHWLEQTAGSGRRRESYMTLGDAASSAQATRIVSAVMAQHSTPTVTTTVAFEPITGMVPGTNLNVGDTVTVPNASLTGESLRVMSLSVSETADDYDWAAELGAIDRSREERMLLQLRKSGPAVIDWSDSANVQATPDAGLGPEKATVLAPAASARTALNDLSDVSTVSDPADLDVLTWDVSLGVGGMWTPRAGTLADFVTGTPNDGDVVTWDATAGEAIWAPIPP
ncbi:MAG: hypothetical protein LC798_19615 [Chloroflexi bacterium]|nr:hypothetical protein [Chloroflexota bacterium]